jgi:membrane protease YdiL (CAAX protease family)
MNTHPTSGPQPLIKQGWLRALILLIVYVFASVAAAIIASRLYGSDGTTIDSMDSPAFRSWAGITFLLSIAIVFLFRKFVDRKPVNSLGLVFHDHRMVFAALALAVFIISFGSFLLFTMGQLEWIDVSARGNSIAMSIGVMLMIAVGEELVFRGYILRHLLKSFDWRVALAISSAAFAIVHAANPDSSVIALINVFLGGIVLGWNFISTRELAFPIVFHFAWNFLQGPVFGYPTSGIDVSGILTADISGRTILTGGSFGFEASIICTVLLLLAVFLLYRFYPIRVER